MKKLLINIIKFLFGIDISTIQTDNERPAQKIKSSLSEVETSSEKITSQNAELKSPTIKNKAKIIHAKQHLNKIRQLPEGTLVEHENLNLGKRTKTKNKVEESKFEYIGNFKFDLIVSSQSDAIALPNVFYPLTDTPIMNWHESISSITTGVTEPNLIKALSQLTDIVPEIKILQNISLSIKNRNHSYRPDIALVWEKYNLIIDIEIDESYDMVSRKPLHFKESADYLRNLYFISQGWVVIRFSEEQVFYQNEILCSVYCENSKRHDRRFNL